MLVLMNKDWLNTKHHSPCESLDKFSQQSPPSWFEIRPSGCHISE